MEEASALKDARRTYHFWVDDVLLDQFGAKLGPFGLAVYMALSRHAKKGTSFPGIARLATETGMSRTSVTRTLPKLEALGLITIEPRYDDDGTQKSNLYTLLDLSSYHQSPSIAQGGRAPVGHPRVAVRHPPPCPTDTLPLSHRHPEGYSEKDTHHEGIPLSISLPPVEDTHTPEETGDDIPSLPADTTFPSDPEGQTCLRSQVITSDLQAWADTRLLHLDMAHEFERWLNHGLAKGKRVRDFSASFRAWLLDPLTQSARHGPGTSREAKQADADAAMRRILEEESYGSGRQTPVYGDAAYGMDSLSRPYGRGTPTGLLVGTPRPLHA